MSGSNQHDGADGNGSGPTGKESADGDSRSGVRSRDGAAVDDEPDVGEREPDGRGEADGDGPASGNGEADVESDAGEMLLEALGLEVELDDRPGALVDPVDLTDLPGDVADLAGACIDYVRQATGVELDLTPETLPLLDHYLELARDELEGRPAMVELVARAAGAYFGEVIRRRYGGYWRIPGDDAHAWRVLMRPVYLSFNPVGVAYDAIAQDANHGGPSSRLGLAHEDRALVAARLEDLPMVTEEDYYLLATRAEVLEIAIAVLKEAAVEGGSGDVTFEETDYDDGE